MTVQFSSQAIDAFNEPCHVVPGLEPATSRRERSGKDRVRMGLLDIYDAQLQSGLNVSEPPPIQVWQTITLAPTTWMLIATQWIQAGG